MIEEQYDVAIPLELKVSHCRVPWDAFFNTSQSEGEPPESLGETEPSESSESLNHQNH